MRTRSTRWGVFLILLLGTPGLAQAWVSQGAPRWSKDSFPLEWAISAAGARDVRDGSDFEAVEAGFEAWAAPTCTFVSLARQADFEDYADLGNCSVGRNWVQWEEDDWPEDLGPNVLAVTLTCFIGGSRTNTSMRFNGVNHDWATNGRARAFDIGSVATHEAGHVLGLGHSEYDFATMYRATGPGDLSQRSLSFDDEDGICALYPTGVPGEPCEDDAFCRQGGGPEAYCEIRWEGGYCTSECGDGCPSGSRCDVAPGESSERCLDTCVTSAGECRPGYACHWVEPGFGFCAPECINDTVCGEGQVCDEGVCRPPRTDIAGTQSEAGCAAASGGGAVALVLLAVAAAGRRRR